MKLTPRDAYAYRGDPAVPTFDDKGPIVFMDGDCALCTRAARAIAKLDRAHIFRICPVATPLGRAIFDHFGLEWQNAKSWLYLENGKAYASVDAVIGVGARLGGLGRALQIFSIMPEAAQDWLYFRIANNRYALFGRKDMCAVPDEALRRRLLS